MAYMIRQGRRAPAHTAPIAPDPSLPKVCIIGAGSSGIAAAKTLYTSAIPFDCFEKGSEIGGTWLFDNPNGQSACYETLQINTSCPRMAFSDFPMPEHYPHYARHDQVFDYFRDYVDHFGFGHTITFNTEVTDVRRGGRGGWDVDITSAAGTETRHYDAVMVANGHHWDARWPDPAYPGEFDGEQIHAHDYRSGDQLEGRDVVVVGAGNSAMDIAVEGSHRARSVNLSIRRGQWVMKKTVMGMATDQVVLPGWAPWWMTSARLRLGALASGGLKRYGLPVPPHTPGQSHPVQSDAIRDRLKAGAVTVRPGIDRLERDRVVFTDGTSAPADLIVWATGYRVSFPFLSSDVVDVENNDLPLWKRMVHPDRPGLFFIGLLQPVGAVMPLSEVQAKLVAKILTGAYELPSRRDMVKQMARDDRRNKKQFYDSPRHTMEVDFDHYLWEIEREMKKRAVAA
ncbi:flavin-containing monooxygenase [Brevibacterium spongiae]|uniref:NAD(P)-binding domain-containing protein n=1 Tax=Brevibacterium spongiae TaxID=2909672 RepID=A0ABY5SSF8_9MICO|nr:NAD(P)-binding domain-containing protein [Brevibacterium spongiae]UVI36821.1 NAD(P)-binding domain-containing protein [Brevibacterium spongiae]